MEDYNISSSNLHIVYPADVFHDLPSGAIQEVRGKFNDCGVWHLGDVIFAVILPSKNESYIRKVTTDEELAVTINWQKVSDKIKELLDSGQSYNEDNTLIDILAEVGIVSIVQVPTNTIVNGQQITQTQIRVDSDFRMEYENIIEPPIVVEM